MGCCVSWLRSLNTDEPWPGGSWQHCSSEVTNARVIRLTDDAVITLSICVAHVELFDAVMEEGDGVFELVKGEMS